MKRSLLTVLLLLVGAILLGALIGIMGLLGHIEIGVLLAFIPYMVFMWRRNRGR